MWILLTRLEEKQKKKKEKWNWYLCVSFLPLVYAMDWNPSEAAG